MARNTDRHVKKTLPPTLSGLPGEAEIRYYVKVTVQRPAFYKENFRAVCVLPCPYYCWPTKRPSACRDANPAYRSHLLRSYLSNRLVLLQINGSSMLDDLTNSVPVLIYPANQGSSASLLCQWIHQPPPCFLQT